MNQQNQPEIEYCTVYHCAGDCGQPHNQKEMQEFLTSQPQQEPVGWLTQARNFVHLMEFTEEEAKLYGWEALYTSSPARKPLTDAEKRELIKKSELWDMHLHVGWYSAPSKSFVEKAIQLIADIEAAHNIKGDA